MKTFLLLLLFGLSPSALAADASQPHPHQGVLASYDSKPTLPKLTADDLVKLATGDAVRKQSRDGQGGRGIAVQDINAPPSVVLSKISYFKNYPTMVDEVKLCEIYEQENDHIKTRFIIGALFVKVEYFIDHTFKPDEGYMSWTLDYSRDSDLDDSVGFWVVQPHPDKPQWSRLFYSVDVRLRGWVPGAIEEILVRNGLTKATSWVKRESEASMAATSAANE